MTHYLVGTIHTDLKGPERLEKLLSWIRPQKVFLEASAEMVEAIKKDREVVDQIPKSEYDLVLDVLCTLNYETWKSLELAENNFEVIPLGSSAKIEAHKKSLDTALRNEIGVGLENSGLDFIEKITSGHTYESFQKAMDENYISSTEVPIDTEMIMRDEGLTVTYLDEISGMTGNSLFLMGDSHFFGNYSPNLYDRIKRDDTCLLKLVDVAKF